MKPYKFIISGGGTGGHIFPALSIANELKRRYPDCEILFVGAEDRMEMEKVPAAGYPIVGLPVSGFDRSSLVKNFQVVARLLKSLHLAKKTVRDFRPDIYDENQNPDTYLEAVLPNDYFYASAFARFHPNDYQNVQQRLPELRFDLQPTELGKTGIYQHFNASYALLREETSDQFNFVRNRFRVNDGDAMESSRANVYIGWTAPIKFGDFAAFNEVYAKYFVSKPARSCVAVKALPKGVLCEIEAIGARVVELENSINDPQVIEIGVFACRLQCCAMLLVPLGTCANMLFQSTGQSAAATFLSSLRQGLYYLPLMLVLPLVIGLRGVQIAQPLADALTFVTSVPFLLRFFAQLPRQDRE